MLFTVFFDSTAVFLAFAATFWLRFHSKAFEAPLGIPLFEHYFSFFPLPLLIFLAVFKSFNLYKERHFLETRVEAGRILKAFSLSILIILFLTYFYRDMTFSRLYLILFVPTAFFLIAGFRKLEIFLEKFIQKRFLRRSNILILGSGPDVRKLESSLRRDFSWGFNRLEISSTQDLFHHKDDAKLHETFLGWKKTGLHEIILVSRGITHEQTVKIILECEKNLLGFHLAPDIFSIITSHVDIINIGGISLLQLKRSPLDKLYNRVIKRLMDMGFSLAGLIALSPLMVIISIIIKRQDSGPVFFRQERCGEDGKLFTIYKFRTMRSDAEAETGPVFAAENDPRRTKIGTFLRSWNMDEIPQLFNVLRGDMSLVGPRPERPHFVERFKNDIPRYMSRHLVKSGITGWAQIHGLRGNTSIEERIKYDLYYIENWSVLMDIKILLLTVFAKKNAY
jgi:exopolysaccharide biosynthesis polyprenyl glycosylphosphotransferase